MSCLEHILFFCPFSKHCWESSKITLPTTSVVTIFQWITGYFDCLSNHNLGLFCAIAWSIWSHRNSVVWNNRFKGPSMVVNEASVQLFQWQSAQVKNAVPLHLNPREGVAVWQKPVYGWVTCNVDAAISMSTNSSAFGCIL